MLALHDATFSMDPGGEHRNILRLWDPQRQVPANRSYAHCHCTFVSSNLHRLKLRLRDSGRARRSQRVHGKLPADCLRMCG